MDIDYEIEGAEAWHNGIPIESCPHEGDQARSWRIGWREAQSEPEMS
ncbi:Rmf/CrpP family protein [Shewanella colwelliana]|nr:Rmf/CrpP family protein [Shewanella colwelliana]MCZ4337641.1 hypothetical protein [Shewanella colwelliana]